MTLMATMTAWWLLRFLFYDKKKQSLTLSRVPGFYIFNNLNQLATILSRVSRVKLTTFISHNGKMRNSFFVKSLHIPSHSTRTEYGSRTTIKGRNKEFSLALEGAEHVLIISLLDRFHDEVASLGQTTEEDESLW